MGWIAKVGDAIDKAHLRGSLSTLIIPVAAMIINPFTNPPTNPPTNPLMEISHA